MAFLHFLATGILVALAVRSLHYERARPLSVRTYNKIDHEYSGL
jgi:hypothetical protein